MKRRRRGSMQQEDRQQAGEQTRDSKASIPAQNLGLEPRTQIQHPPRPPYPSTRASRGRQCTATNARPPPHAGAPSGDAMPGKGWLWFRVSYKVRSMTALPHPLSKGGPAFWTDRTLARVDWSPARPLRRAQSSGAKRQSSAPCSRPCV